MNGSEAMAGDGPLVCVVGPTAVGKTALAVELARRFGGEVVNADSRQVYRGMTIGTAKPTLAEQDSAPHHLLDIHDPPEPFGLSLFLGKAWEAVTDISSLGRLPIVCGGTGQYVWALAEGQRVPAVPPDPEFRALLEAEAERLGADALHQRLGEVDPARAAALDARNVRRVIRALEVHHVTGRLPSDMRPVASEETNALVLGLTMPRESLYRRIDERVDRMMADGFLQEVERLAESGLPFEQGPLDSPGYRELGMYLRGELTLEESVERTKTQTHRLARRQYAWFKLSDPRIRWLEADGPEVGERAAEAVSAFLRSQPPVIQ